MKPKIKDDLSEHISNIMAYMFENDGYLTSCLGDIGADILGLVLALLHKHGVALLGVHLLPDHGLVGGHINAELLVVQVNIAAVTTHSCVLVVVGCPPLYPVLTLGTLLLKQLLSTAAETSPMNQSEITQNSIHSKNSFLRSFRKSSFT